ncbi:hypothetical protein BH09PSE3_BH09PSE3_10370 [soil metagenome]
MPQVGFVAPDTQINTMTHSYSRRHFIKLSTSGLAIMAARNALATVPNSLSPTLMSRARSAVLEHRARISHVDRVGIVDFSQPSCVPRLFIVDLETGHIDRHLVAHGRGSDPAHTGWLQRFSNDLGSFASSKGAFVTAGNYVGAHGRSMRLIGLDHENSNANLRAIVIHGAPYVSAEIARETGVLGRSEGCFAVAPTSRETVLNKLGPGRLLYAARL